MSDRDSFDTALSNQSQKSHWNIVSRSGGGITASLAWAVIGTVYLGLLLPLISFAQSATPLSFTPQSNANFDGSIPIRVPAGSGGFTPQMTLGYSSHTLNTPSGLGFALLGPPAITRCGRTLAQDGIRSSVNYDRNDRFCLYGQRLVVTNGGVYGGNDTIYGTELDTFIKVTSHGVTGTGPSYFTVQTKTNFTETFGNAPTSGVLAVGTDTLRLWPMTKVSDQAGDAYTFTYTQDAVNGSYYPNTISYMGQGPSAPRDSIVFTFSPRTDVIRNWINGSPISIVDRLTAVAVVENDQPIRQYHLNYDNDAAGGTSRLVSIQECPTGAACLPTVAFKWSGGAASSQSGTFKYTTWTPPDPLLCSPDTGTLMVGNFSGSGRADLFCATASAQHPIRALASNGDGTFTQGSSWPTTEKSQCTSGQIFFGDFNGDGLLDVGCAAAGIVEVGLSTGGGNFGAATLWTPPANTNCSAAGTTIMTGDFDGDGRADLLCVLEMGSSASVLVAFSQANGSFIETSARPWTWCKPQYLHVADINGDGKADLLCLNSSTGQVIGALSNGDGTFRPGTESFTCPGEWGEASKMIPGDFNGDGKSDVLCSDNGGHQSVAFSTGNGNFTAVSAHAFADASSWCAGGVLAVGDFNGDGKADLLCRNASKQSLAFSKGDGSFTAPTRPGSDWCPVGNLLVGDISGDGEADLICSEAGMLKTALSIGAPDLLTGVDNGAGSTVTAAYLPLTNPNIYSKDSGSDVAVFPMQDTIGPYYVVSSVSRVVGKVIGGPTHYHYGGLKVDLTGRGSLGFRTVASTNEQTSESYSSTYQQTFPYTGQSIKTLFMVPGRGNGGLLKETLRTYYCNNLPSCPITLGAKYFVSTHQVVETGWDKGGSALPTSTVTNTFDAYGNELSVTSAPGNGHTTTSNSRYEAPDLTNWQLGRLLDSQVSVTTP